MFDCFIILVLIGWLVVGQIKRSVSKSIPILIGSFVVCLFSWFLGYFMDSIVVIRLACRSAGCLIAR